MDAKLRKRYFARFLKVEDRVYIVLGKCVKQVVLFDESVGGALHGKNVFGDPV